MLSAINPQALPGEPAGNFSTFRVLIGEPRARLPFGFERLCRRYRFITLEYSIIAAGFISNGRNTTLGRSKQRRGHTFNLLLLDVVLESRRGDVHSAGSNRFSAT